MKRITLTFSLLLAASNSYAAWEKIADFGEHQLYLEKDRIRKNGTTYKFWTLHSYDTSQVTIGQSYQSSITLNELNCKEESIRVLSRSDYEAKMGEGKSNGGFDTPGTWSNVAPGTVADYYLQRLCYKKKM